MVHTRIRGRAAAFRDGDLARAKKSTGLLEGGGGAVGRALVVVLPVLWHLLVNGHEDDHKGPLHLPATSLVPTEPARFSSALMKNLPMKAPLSSLRGLAHQQ